ncbi:MAG: DNA mismatch repair endonuclease MutL, partial [Bacteroidales bacterium]|nr:DNA mismatch repair endonuclease MutL [Bacteroidales bacterium]
MADTISVLPDSVANQIAAGEVIQRPASLVKELVENAVDAGADSIQVILKDAGRTLVQVVDNGCGMSETDARLCFDRHATSKIKQADDLYAIRTMGFRGEALASIGAVAQVEMRTSTGEHPGGTRIVIHGSEIQLQEPTACPDGTSIAVKNLFYNVPVRRKFLKSNTTELRHILTEFHRIVLAHPRINFQLFHNNSEIYHLQASQLHQRILSVFGKGINQNIIKIQADTLMINLSGYIGKPKIARKKFGEQFFFVNQRFMKHPYFHKAIMQCYERLIPPDAIPSYFIFLDIDPSRIDVNIHPTKTEIKFEDEKAIYQILQATVKKSLGKFSITPSLDFNQEGAIEIPVPHPGEPVSVPEIKVDPEFNPFASHPRRTAVPQNWERLYSRENNHDNIRDQSSESMFSQHEAETPSFIQLKNKFILTPVKSGLMVIHQVRAYERILYEQFLKNTGLASFSGQKSLFPVTIELSIPDEQLLLQVAPSLKSLGIELEPFGGQSVLIRSLPEILSDQDPKTLIEQLIEALRTESLNLKEHLREMVAGKLAGVAAPSLNRYLNNEERRFLIDELFACK